MSEYLILPDYSVSKGGPGSFYRRFVSYLKDNHGLSPSSSFKPNHRFLLIINGTRRIDILLLAILYNVSISTRLGSFYRSNLFTDQSIQARLVYSFRLLLISFSVLCSEKIIFQSDTVRHEWTKSILGSLFRSKQLYTIYNSVPSHPFRYCGLNDLANTCIDLISLEANHCPPDRSFPFHLFYALQASGINCNLHIFGSFRHNLDSIDKSLLCKIKTYGFLPLESVQHFVSQFHNPLYVVEDNFPCGCPNSMLEMHGMGIPAVALNHTVASELITKFNTGIVVPISQSHLKQGRMPVIDINFLTSNLSDSYSHHSANCFQFSESLRPSRIFQLYCNCLLS